MKEWVVGVIAVVLVVGSAAARPYHIMPGQVVTISAVHHYTTPASDTDLVSVLPRLREAQRTSPTVSTVANVGPDSVSWVSFYVVVDSAVAEPVLRFDITYTIYLDVWSITKNGIDGPRRSGFGYGRERRDLNTTIPAVRLLPSGADTTLIVIRLSGEGNKLMGRAPTIESRDTFENEARLAIYVNGLFFGLVFALLMYNLFVYIATRERAYLAYVASTMATFSWMFAFESLPNVLLPERFSALTVPLMFIGGGFGTLCGTWFVTTLLRTREIMPRYHRALVVLMVLCGLYVIALFVTTRPPLSDLSNLFGLIQAAMVTVAGVIAYKRKVRVARYFLLAFGVLLMSLFYWSGSNLGFIPRVIDGFAALRIGTAFELLVLSLALADRLNSMRRDKEEADRKALEAEILRLRTVELEEAHARSNRLLLNILPEEIAERMKVGEERIAEAYDDVAVVFADIASFTEWSSDLTPTETVEYLDTVFSAMDALTEQFGLEKIKTIGDCYMVVCGVPNPVSNALERTAEYALALRDLAEQLPPIPHTDNIRLRLRIGLDHGSVVAGVIGKKKFSFDLWGQVVNMASRMESHGLVGQIRCTEHVQQALASKFSFSDLELLNIKGKGQVKTYLLRSKL